MKLPIVSGQDLLKFLTKQGFTISRQKGSHVIIKKITLNKVLTSVVPLHDALDPGTLQGILQQCEISREEFLTKW